MLAGLLSIYLDTDACKPNPCKNGASCTDNNGTPECLCQPRFEGERCESKLEKFHKKLRIHCTKNEVFR